MSTGIDNHYSIHGPESLSSAADANNGKRKQSGLDREKPPKRLRLDSTCTAYLPTRRRADSICCESSIATRPCTVLPPSPSLALFRKSTPSPAKKHTRPPTKRVFESLRLLPEEWVRLEGEAKAFMLDTAHPERQACVGNRANGPTNDTKINLYRTVQRFLESDIGARFFYMRLDEDDLEERWVYPRDETALISLLTPLMRRMVTNERQRQYAKRTRAALQQRDKSPFQHDTTIDNHAPLIHGPEHPCSQRAMEIFYLTKGTTLFHRHATEEVSIEYSQLHESVLAECANHRPAASLRNLKIHVHGPYKLELVDDDSWKTVRDEITGAAWTAEGPIKVVVQCE
ncbi:hypothetical protein FKW77_000482 [Venturia effusa]|uniref:Uncharacterized protein n=1 Tax=Venturia effusa TaxID=50376 RepID=A0A517L4S0_9PEZI|nr:hypothetical protein FKW77_000482 [Venturia effusa]